MEALSNEIRRIAREVLLALTDDSDAASGEAVAPASARLACCVRFDGKFRGQVLVHASAGLALLVARRMFDQEPATPLSAESQEALRELTNIIAGNLKPLLGAGLHLGLPEDLPLDAPYPDLQSMAEAIVDHYGERLEVRVFLAA